MYNAFLGRPVDDSGLAFWSAYLHTVGIRRAGIALLASAECYAELSLGVF
jgi:hypothetical protein